LDEIVRLEAKENTIALNITGLPSCLSIKQQNVEKEIKIIKRTEFAGL
jgi:hypothetical protein